MRISAARVYILYTKEEAMSPAFGAERKKAFPASVRGEGERNRIYGGMINTIRFPRLFARLKLAAKPLTSRRGNSFAPSISIERAPKRSFRPFSAPVRAVEVSGEAANFAQGQFICPEHFNRKGSQTVFRPFGKLRRHGKLSYYCMQTRGGAPCIRQNSPFRRSGGRSPAYRRSPRP